MNKNAVIKVFLLAILMLTQRVILADESCAIVNIWEEGEYSLRQECFFSLITSAGKGEQTFDQTRTTFDWQAKVSEFQADGTQKIDLQARRIKLRFENKETAYIFFDSSNKSLTNKFETEVFKRFMNSVISVTFKNGEVVAISMDDSVWKGLSPKSDSETIFLNALQALPTLDNFKQIFDPFLWASNPNEIKTNDSWKNEVAITLPVVGERSMTWNCKLKSVKKSGTSSVANVLADSNFDVKVDEHISANMKAEMDVKFNVNSGTPIELIGKSTVSAIRKSEDENEPDLKITVMQKNNLTVVKR